MTENETNNQIAKKIYHKIMSNMKYTLELEEFSYREKGRNDPKYKTFKKHLMSNTYEMMRSLFQELTEIGIMEKTEYPEDVKDGYQSNESGGSGYINTQDIDEWIVSGEEDSD